VSTNTPRVERFHIEHTTLGDGLLRPAANLYEVRDGDGVLLWVCRAVGRCMRSTTEFRDVEHGPVRFRMDPARLLFNRTWRLFDAEHTTPFASVTSTGGGLWRLLDVRDIEQARIVDAAQAGAPARAAYALVSGDGVLAHVHEAAGGGVRSSAMELVLLHDTVVLDPRLLVAAMVLLQEHTVRHRRSLSGAR
jgi:hypothetical protein